MRYSKLIIFKHPDRNGILICYRSDHRGLTLPGAYYGTLGQIEDFLDQNNLEATVTNRLNDEEVILTALNLFEGRKFWVDLTEEQLTMFYIQFSTDPR